VWHVIAGPSRVEIGLNTVFFASDLLYHFYTGNGRINTRTVTVPSKPPKIAHTVRIRGFRHPYRLQPYTIDSINEVHIHHHHGINQALVVEGRLVLSLCCFGKPKNRPRSLSSFPHFSTTECPTFWSIPTLSWLFTMRPAYPVSPSTYHVITTFNPNTALPPPTPTVSIILENYVE